MKLKISTLIFLICFLFQNSYSQQNTSGWYWLNSQPQGNDLNWTKIIDATHYYAVGEAGTFMKSSDGGDTWLVNSLAGVLDPSFGSGATLRLYSAWFFDANTGIVAGQSVSGDGGIIRRTTDGGETFSNINLGIASGLSRVKDIYFINSTTGYLCGTNPVKAFKTINAGLNWTLLPNLPSSTIDYNCVYARDANNIYLGAATDGSAGTRRIVRTSNAGSTWKIDTLPGSTIVDIKDIGFQNSNTGFVCGNSVATNPPYFAYTVNGGLTWTETGFPNKQMGLYHLQVIGSTVYTLGSYDSYYYTSNLGVSWDSVNFSDPSNPNQPTIPYIVYSFDISGSDAIVVGINGKINISNDGGSSWRNKNYSVGNNLYTFAGVYALPGTQKVWAVGAGGMVLYSPDRGNSWVKQPINLNYGLKDIEMIDANTGITVGGNPSAGEGYCYKTTNGGTNWNVLPIPDPTQLITTVDMINANVAWIFGGLPFGSGSTIAKTTDGGATWTSQVTTPLYNSTISQGAMSDINNGWLVSGSFVAKTTNGGTNWNQVTISPSNGWSVVKMLSSSVIFLGGGQLINKSTDGGANWTTVSIPSTASIFNMEWADINNGTIVGTQGYTAKTSDGGLTWKERNTGSSTLTGVSLIGSDTVFAVCDRNVYGAIFRLYDNAPSFTFNTTIGIQAYWDGVTQVSDTVKCHLRKSTSPYTEVAVATAVTNSSGNATFTFTNAPAGSYYLEITQRNSLETWSSQPQAVTPGGNYNYNFTTAASQAYGNNLILSDGRYCNYSGDVNQDGFVDLMDVNLTFNGASNYAVGYVVTDVNGDGIVDLSDLIFVFNNSSNFVQKSTP